MFRIDKPRGAFLKTDNFSLYRNYQNKRTNHERLDRPASLAFYDHDCPLCRHEMLRLKSLDREGRLILVDINDPRFSERYRGVSRFDLSQAMHVLTAERIWLVGMPAIRHLYSQVGLGFLLAPTAWPLLSRLADCAYRKFAPNRVAVSRWLGLRKAGDECRDGSCSAKTNTGGGKR